MSPYRLTLGDILGEHRRSCPDRIALVDGARRLTWAALDERVTRLANALAAVGIGPGERILWLGQNSFRVYELLIAAARLGAMLCVGCWRWAPPEVVFAVRDFDPRMVVWQDLEIGRTLARARDELGGDGRVWLRHDTDGPGGYEPFLAGGAVREVDRPVDPDSAVLVLYTAAMDGRPSGSMLSHTNLIHTALTACWLGDIDGDVSFLNSGPMFHIGNYQFWGLPTFVHGGTNVLVRRAEPARILELLVVEQCTHAFLMPPTVAAIVELNRTAGHDLSRLRATVAPHLWEGMAGVDDSRFARCGGADGRGYGQTELSGFAVTGAFGGPGIGPAGRPGPGVSLRIVDTGGAECATGQAGEICVRGPTVHLGYWNRPELNTHRFRGGWWHTTDVGRREADGTVTFLGTMTRMLKSAAENIYPAEVEDCIRAHPAVREVAVIGTPNRRWAQDVKAVVVPTEGATVGERDIVEFCRPRIASYKKPRTVEFVGALPRTAAGAVDYDALDERFGGGGYPGVHSTFGTEGG